VTDPRRATNTTIPALRIFDEKRALEFYVEFLGFALDFGGPSGGPGTPFHGQVIRESTTLHLTEQPYDPNPRRHRLGVDDRARQASATTCASPNPTHPTPAKPFPLGLTAAFLRTTSGPSSTVQRTPPVRAASAARLRAQEFPACHPSPDLPRRPPSSVTP
jgi:hypothetical protein